MHAAPLHMTTQELHVALLAEIFGYKVPCESEHGLLRYARMLSNGSIVPYTKCANDANENVMKGRITSRTNTDAHKRVHARDFHVGPTQPLVQPSPGSQG